MSHFLLKIEFYMPEVLESLEKKIGIKAKDFKGEFKFGV